MKENRLIYQTARETARAEARRKRDVARQPQTAARPTTSRRPTRKVISQTRDPKTGTRFTETQRPSEASAFAGRPDPNRGIRLGQFGEIDEEAGERVRIDPQTGIATVQDAQGNILRQVGDTTTISERTQQTRRGAPISPQAGAGGQRGERGITPDTGEFSAEGEKLFNERLARLSRGEGVGGKSLTPGEISELITQRAQRKSSFLEQQRTQNEIDRAKRQEQQTIAAGAAAGAEAPEAPRSFSAQDVALNSVPPEIQDLFGAGAENLRNIATRSRGEFENALNDIEDSRGVADRVFDIGSRMAIDSRERQLDLEGDMEDLARERSEENERKDLATGARSEELFNLQFNQQKQQIRDQNIQNELQNRRLAAKMGINFDTGGLDWMQREVRSGQEMLSNLTQRAAIGNKQFADQRISISNQYALRMDEIDLTGRAQRDKIFDDFRTSIQSLTKERLLTERELATERKDARQRYYDQLNSVDTFVAEQYVKERDAARKEEARVAKDERDSFDNRIDYQRDVRKDIQGTKAIQQASEVRQKVDGFEVAFIDAERIQSAINATDDKVEQKALEKNFGPADVAMLNMYQKILDPGSVVRPSEFDQVPEASGLLQSMKAKMLSVAFGGVLTPEIRKSMKRLTDEYGRLYDIKLQQAVQPFIDEIDEINASGRYEKQIELRSVVDLELLRLPTTTTDMWKRQAAGDTGTRGSDINAPGFLSANEAPPQGFRTDRHNNPTAFTIGIAKQAGLEEGVDYEFDEQLAAGFPTAKLLGDPIDTTIRVIDNIGFFTGKGRRRWTHTAMTKDQWNSLTRSQKEQIITEMYQKEGGTGVLVNNQIA